MFSFRIAAVSSSISSMYYLSEFDWQYINESTSCTVLDVGICSLWKNMDLSMVSLVRLAPIYDVALFSKVHFSNWSQSVWQHTMNGNPRQILCKNRIPRVYLHLLVVLRLNVCPNCFYPCIKIYSESMDEYGSGYLETIRTAFVGKS